LKCSIIKYYLGKQSSHIEQCSKDFVLWQLLTRKFIRVECNLERLHIEFVI